MLAQDRSMRRIDADGHLHVEMTNISKANVCPYYGREIPDYEALGLDPGRVYMLYRDPSELQRGAETFQNKPLLMQHIPISADEPARDLWVGVVGAPASFDGTYLKAPISVWTAEGIELIDSREREQLSSAYRYRADMTRGRTPHGVAYDGIMRDIVGNHVALVEEGRAGPDVMVADDLPPEFSNMKRPRFFAAFAKLFAEPIPAATLVALDKAMDEDMDDAEMSAAMDAMTPEEKKAACDAYCASAGKAADAMDETDKKEAFSRAVKAKKALDKLGAQGKPAALSAPAAADSAAVKATVDAAVAEATKDFVKKDDAIAATKIAVDAAIAATNDLHAARLAVAPTVGNDVALDSAEKVYRFALDKLKVEHKDVPASALKSLYLVAVKKTAAPVATDSKPVTAESLFPALSNIRQG